MPAYAYILSYVEREDDPLVDTLAGDATADLIVLNSIKKVCGVEIDDDTVFPWKHGFCFISILNQ